MSMTSPAILSNFFEKQWTQNHPQYPTTFFEIAADYSGFERNVQYMYVFIYINY